MKTTIAIFDSHEKALKAIQTLKEANFPSSNLSMVGKAEMIDNHLHVRHSHLPEASASIGAVGGSALGILTGLGVFAIPGFGFLFGAGALVGALAGFDIGIISGGVAAILAKLGLKNEHEEVPYDQHLHEGKVLVVAQGSEEEINSAKEILEGHGINSNA